MPSPPVFVLNVHHDYACRRSGACCTAGWDIGVDQDVHDRVQAAFGAGAAGMPGPERLFVRGEEHPPGVVAFMARTEEGGCICLDRKAGNLCAIQRQLGHGAMPAACRHFPRVTLVDDTGVYVTLSHFCPTAASLLFRDDMGAVAALEDPPAFAGRTYEGFDARNTPPPFLRPGVVFDRVARRVWDRFVLDVLNRDAWLPGQALARVEEGARRLRAWTPRTGPLASVATGVLDRVLGEAAAIVLVDPERVAELFEAVASAVPPGLQRPALPAGGTVGLVSRVPADWAGLSRPVRRYLAARAFGAWSAYQGEGVLTETAVLAAALAVLHVEASRAVAAAKRPLDAGILLEAIRAADLLIVHLASPEHLVGALGAVERA